MKKITVVAMSGVNAQMRITVDVMNMAIVILIVTAGEAVAVDVAVMMMIAQK